MRVLLDEDVPRPLRRDLVGHEVSTVQEMGWASVKNGVLLGLAAAAGFEVLLTCDRGMQYQQNVPALGLALTSPLKRPQTQTTNLLRRTSPGIRPLAPATAAGDEMTKQGSNERGAIPS